MAYSLQIERSDFISKDEWIAAVETIDNLKLDVSDAVATNPATGEEIRIPGAVTDAALWFPDLAEWVKVFYFRRGKIVFKGNDWNDLASPVRDTAIKLAQKLNAEIISDNGEKY